MCFKLNFFVPRIYFYGFFFLFLIRMKLNFKIFNKMESFTWQLLFWALTLFFCWVDFEEMQLTSVQGFRMWGLNIFSCHIDKVLCGASTWILFSLSFIWNPYASSPPALPQVLWALESEMKDWIHKSCVVTVKGFGSFTWTAGGPGATTPLPHWCRLLPLFLQEWMCSLPGCS